MSGGGLARRTRRGSARRAIVACVVLALGASPIRADDDTAAARLARTVQAELRQLEAEASGTEGIDLVALRARIALRRMAFDLLVRGDEAPPERSVAAMEGFRLADARRSVDTALARGLLSAEGGGTPRPRRDRERVLRGLDRFAELAPRAMAIPGLIEPDRLDGALATALRPLVDALATLEGLPADAFGTGWPVEPNGRTSPEPSTPAGPDAARWPLSAAAWADVTSDGTDRRRRAAARLAAALGDCPWFPDARRTPLDAELAGAVADGEPDDPRNPSATLSFLEARAALAESIAASLAGDPRRFERIRPGAIAPVVSTLAPDEESRERLGTARLARIAVRMRSVLEAAAESPAEAGEVARDLRVARRALVERSREADRAALARLADLLATPDALVDPAVLATFTAQRDAADDLARLDRIDVLARRMGGVRPQASEPIRRRLVAAAEALADPGRRERAASAFDALAGQVDRFAFLPFEDALRRETPEATELSGGKAAELAATIGLTRADWADAWARGESSGEAAEAMGRLWRLARAMDLVAEFGFAAGVDRREAGLLSAWGGFHAPRGVLGPALVDLPARIRLACLAALEAGKTGDADAFERGLADLERDLPLVALVATLRERLRRWLDERPPPPVGILAATREPPEPEAFALRQRLPLARIARGLRDLEELRRDGKDREATELHRELSLVATETVRALRGDLGGPLPEVPDLAAPPPPRNRRGSPPRQPRRLPSARPVSCRSTFSRSLP